MEIAIVTSIWRFLAAFSGLVFFSAMEVSFQFRKPLESRVKHYIRNLFLGLSNGLILHITVGGLIVAYYDVLAKHGIGVLNLLNLDSQTNIILSLIFLDFITYVWHRAYHEVPFLWRLHRVHHSDLDLDVTSASRFHISEVALSSVFKMLVGLLWGPSAIALAVHEAALGAAAQFHHANIRITEPWESLIRRVLVTPDMHHVHHSNKVVETNSNYSNLFSIWDRLLGTYTHLTEHEKIIYGLEEYPRLEEVSFKKLLLMPFGPHCEIGRNGKVTSILQRMNK
jgi:sterol desaturase/sphingolipid hydroxylase (fatty acid hydroxylase superfamily)